MISVYLKIQFKEVKQGINEHPGYEICKLITQSMWDYISAEFRLSGNFRFSDRVQDRIKDQLGKKKQ